ncbi:MULTISPECIES: hypothetical protein [Deinococcus]|uniref:Uncharacterized protein n=1 Tax=Deinococcus ruber TaxID=1848197 RepID=A0A918BVA2_9DEIO|nr:MULTISPECIES: hypothetical protein [Deinococcus]ULH16215.1 hypothetical protein MF271_06270 [Deinococcus sp. KNUC1210]GGQ94474.1 hypothetical protein GCM10008957_03280 [Deinococcus ruber]
MEKEIETMLTMDVQASTLQWIYKQLLMRGCRFEWRETYHERKFAVLRGNLLLAEANDRSDFYKVKAGLLKARAALAIPPRY